MNLPLLASTAVAVLVGTSGCTTRPIVAVSDTSPTPTVAATKVATVGQYAGLVAGSRTDIRKAWDGYYLPCIVGEEDSLRCRLGPATLRTEALTLVLKLDAARKPGIAAYVGEPPAEIAKLVTDTRDAAAGVVSVVTEDWEVPSKALLHLAMVRLLDVFDRWEPYL